MTAKPLDLVDPKAIEHLFEVAAKLFSEKGLSGVSVREISRASNVSVAAIYYHFKSKEGLFAEVSLHRYEDFERELIKRIGSQQSDSSQRPDPVTVALAFFDMMMEDDKLLRMVQRDMITGSPDHESFLSRHPLRHFRGIIDDMLGFAAADPGGEMKSFSFAAILNGYAELAMADITNAREQRAQYLAKHRKFLAQFVKIAFASPAQD